MAWLRRVAVSAWRAPLVVHVVVYAIVLLVAVAAGGVSQSATSDEGAYLIQARALDRGAWAVTYPQAADDPNYTHFPFINADVRTTGGYLFGARPAYPWLLSKVVNTFGEGFGAHLLSMLGALAAAAVAWAVGGAFDERLKRPMFWLVALGPPLVNASFVWAHAPSAAVGGLAVLGMVSIARARADWWAWPALLIGLVAGVLLRTEGALFTAAIVAALAALLVRGRRFVPAIGVGAVGGVSLLALLAQRAWAHHLEHGAAIVGPPSSGGGRLLDGIAHDVVSTSFFEPKAQGLGIGVVLLLAIAIALIVHGAPSRLRDAHVLLAVAGVLAVLRIAVTPNEVSIGLLYGWPVVLVAVFGTRWRDLDLLQRAIVGAVVIFTVLLAATDYGSGGGFEWAGRYLSPITVPLALLAAAATMRAVRSPATLRWLVAALAIIPTATGLHVMATVRHQNTALVDAVSRTNASIVVTEIPALPRLDWRSYPDRTYLLSRDDADVGPTLALAARGRPDRIGLVGAESAPPLGGYSVRQLAGEESKWVYERQPN